MARLLIFIILIQFCAAQNYSENVTSYDQLPPPYPIATSILFIFMILLFGVIVRALMLWTSMCLPYRVVMFAIGALLGYLANVYPAFKPIVTVCFIDVEYLLLMFLPIILFNISYSVDAHSFWKSFPQIILVSVPGVMLTSSMVAFMAYFVIESNWSFETALLFGIICSPIYPMEVVRLLKEASKCKFISVLLLGEGVIGDATVMVFFTVMFGFLAQAVSSPAQISLMLLRFAGGGILLGIVMGQIVGTIVSLTYYDLLCAVTVTCAGAYLTYYIGEKFLYVSGLLGTVIAGVIVSNRKATIAGDVEQIVTNFWIILSHAANTLIFSMVGVVIFETMASLISLREVSLVFVTYATVYVSRLLAYGLMTPLLRCVGYGMTWQHSLACVWGGLRGPLSLCLALLVRETPEIAEVGNVMVIQTTGLVILSLIINATTMQKVLKVLGLSQISLAKKANMTNCVKRIMMTRDRCISMLKMDKFLADANWDLVQDGTQIKHPYQTQIVSGREEESDDETYMGYRYTTCPDCERDIPNEPTKKEFAEMMREANQRVLKSLKISFWRQYEYGKISKEGVRILVQAVETAADSENGWINLDQLGTLWKPKAHAVWLRRRLVNMITPEAANARIPRAVWRQRCYRFVSNVRFDVFIYVMILFNTPVILCEVAMTAPSPTVVYSIKALNVFFFVIYFLEMVIKMCAFGVKGYFVSHWNKLDFFIVVMASGDFALDLLDTSVPDFNKYASLNSSILTATKLLRMLRFLRLCKLARVTVPKFMSYMDRMIDKQLAFGYDVGKPKIEVTKFVASAGCTEDAAAVATLPEEWQPRRSGPTLHNYLKNREQDHKTVIQDLTDSSKKINAEVDAKIRRLAENLLAHIRQNESDMNCIITTCDTGEPLGIEERNSAFKNVQSLYSQRIEDIQQFKREALDLEKERADGLRNLLRDIFQRAVAVGNKPPKELLHDFDERTYEANQQLLSNFRAYTELEAKLTAEANENVKRAKSTLNQLCLGVELLRTHSAQIGPQPLSFSRQSNYSAGSKKSQNTYQLDSILTNVSEIEDCVALIVESYKKAVMKIVQRFSGKLTDLSDELEARGFSELDFREYDSDELRNMIKNALKRLSNMRLPNIGSKSPAVYDISRLETSFHKLGMRLQTTYLILHDAGHLWNAHIMRSALAQKLTLAAVEDLVTNNDCIQLANEVQFNIVLEQMRACSDAEKLLPLYTMLLSLLDKTSELYQQHCANECGRLEEYMKLTPTMADTLHAELNCFMEKYPKEHSDPSTMDMTREESLLDTAQPIPRVIFHSEIQTLSLLNWKNGFLESFQGCASEISEDLKRQAEAWVKEKKSALDLRYTMKMMSHSIRAERVKAAYEARLAQILHHKARLSSHIEAMYNFMNNLPVEVQQSLTFETPELYPVLPFIERIEENIEEMQANVDLDPEIKRLKMLSYSLRLTKLSRLFEESVDEYLNEYRKSVEQKIQAARISNIRFLSAIRLFYERGCYSAQESLSTLGGIVKAGEALELCLAKCMDTVNQQRSVLLSELERRMAPLRKETDECTKTGKGVLKLPQKSKKK